MPWTSIMPVMMSDSIIIFGPGATKHLVSYYIVIRDHSIMIGLITFGPHWSLQQYIVLLNIYPMDDSTDSDMAFYWVLGIN